MTDLENAINYPENEQILVRKEKLNSLRKIGNPFPNDFKPNDLAEKIHKIYTEKSDEELLESAIAVKIAGRIMTRRIMGKASFAHIQDRSGRIQIYLNKNDLKEELYQNFLDWDIGDIIGIEGILFKTKTQELTIKTQKITLLTKALRPLPDKFHGLSDHELRYRQRYLDLLINAKSRNIFYIRSQIVAAIRRFLIDNDFLEVETPMMQLIPGGASARPFITHHNALDMQLFLRIAPELYLKRLVVGGMERVFEINRNFRNEGISTRHNPEFTMLEFYQSYADYKDLMDLTEKMLKTITKEVLGTSEITYQGQIIDFAKPILRLTMQEAICQFNQGINEKDLYDKDKLKEIVENLAIATQKQDGIGKLQYAIFEKTVERNLKQPTFITAFPAEVSPLARKNGENPLITDRFEFFVGGQEIANGFSELNDPEEQAARFLQQVKEREAGDQEAMYYDNDYIMALEHGLPPTAGEGIGIDRLVMLLTDSPSIRDVILFPLLKPQG